MYRFQMTTINQRRLLLTLMAFSLFCYSPAIGQELKERVSNSTTIEWTSTSPKKKVVQFKLSSTEGIDGEINYRVKVEKMSSVSRARAKKLIKKGQGLAVAEVRKLLLRNQQLKSFSCIVRVVQLKNKETTISITPMSLTSNKGFLTIVAEKPCILKVNGKSVSEIQRLRISGYGF